VANLIGCGLIIALNLLLKNISEKETEMKKCFSSTLTILLFLCFVLSLAGCSGSGNSSRNPVAAIYAATGGGLSSPPMAARLSPTIQTLTMGWEMMR